MVKQAIDAINKMYPLGNTSALAIPFLDCASSSPESGSNADDDVPKDSEDTRKFEDDGASHKPEFNSIQTSSPCSSQCLVLSNHNSDVRDSRGSNMEEDGGDHTNSSSLHNGDSNNENDMRMRHCKERFALRMSRARLNAKSKTIID